MIDSADITVQGKVGTDPTLRFKSDGTPWTHFRMCVTPRYRGDDGQFRDGVSQWFDVTVWNASARNVGLSVRKGMTVVVRGKVKPRSWTGKDGEQLELSITAESVAVELSRGMVHWTRTAQSRPGEADAPEDGAVLRQGPTVTGPDGSQWEGIELADDDDPYAEVDDLEDDLSEEDDDAELEPVGAGAGH